MIVKDEEEVLARCLNSVKDAVDEIIIVDTGSTDKTKEIAKSFTDHVFDFQWINDFSAARNKAFSMATMDYQMWLDADDVMPPESVEKMIRLKKTLAPTVDIVTMKYITHFDVNGNPILVSTRERLTKREKNYQWIDPVHECIPLIGNCVNSDIEIHHKKIKFESQSDRNINIYKSMEKSGKPFTPRQQYYYARELKDHHLWGEAAYYFEKFLQSGKGWFEDNIASCYNLSICYKEMKEEQKVMPILLQSFLFDAPRAEICSEIGYYFKRSKQFRTALKWFDLAAGLGEPDSIGFILRDYWGYIPNIECCVCCCELRDYKAANQYNEKAATCKSHTLAVEMNRRHLAEKLKDA